MTFKAGIIGAGGIAGLGILGMHDEEDIGRKKFEASHAGGYDASEETELTAVADVNEDKLRTFADAWDIPEERTYTDHKEMLAVEDLDIVSVCTPSYLHHEHVLAAAQSAANPDIVWCEKPIASSVSDGEEMINVCERTTTELVVNHSFRFTKKYQKLREQIIQDNLLGDVHSVTAQYRMELLRNSTHVIDTLVYLLDSHAEAVNGYVNDQNEAVSSLDAVQAVDDAGGGGFVVMDDETFVTIDCTIPRADSSMTFQFVGSQGKLYMNNDDGEWRYWRLEGNDHIEKPLPGFDEPWTWDDDYQSSFANAATHLEQILHGNSENLSTGEDALRSLEIIVGFYISEYTGSRVNIPLDRPLRDIKITSW